MDELAQIDTGAARYSVRRAVAGDVAAIVKLIADDQIGRGREDGDLAPYLDAFASIDADPAHLLVVVTDAAQAVVGTLQVSFIPGLARRGALRAQIGECACIRSCLDRASVKTCSAGQSRRRVGAGVRSCS